MMEHSINTGSASQIKEKPYRVPEAKRKIIEEELQLMLIADIINPSRSPWSSTVGFVTKPNGAARFCVDYSRGGRTLSQLSHGRQSTFHLRVALWFIGRYILSAGRH